MAYLGISRRAARDLEEIRSFSVEHWGHRAAEEYLDHIEEALQRLRQNPTLLRTKPEFSRHLRFFRVRRHYLVCSLMGDNIYLVTVKHGSLDPAPQSRVLGRTFPRTFAAYFSFSLKNMAGRLAVKISKRKQQIYA